MLLLAGTQQAIVPSSLKTLNRTNARRIDSYYFALDCSTGYVKLTFLMSSTSSRSAIGLMRIQYILNSTVQESLFFYSGEGLFLEGPRVNLFQIDRGSGQRRMTDCYTPLASHACPIGKRILRMMIWITFLASRSVEHCLDFVEFSFQSEAVLRTMVYQSRDRTNAINRFSQADSSCNSSD